MIFGGNFLKYMGVNIFLEIFFIHKFLIIQYICSSTIRTLEATVLLEFLSTIELFVIKCTINSTLYGLHLIHLFDIFVYIS